MRRFTVSLRVSIEVFRTVVAFAESLGYEISDVSEGLGVFQIRVYGSDRISDELWEKIIACGGEISPHEIESLPIDDGMMGFVFVPGYVGVPVPRSEK